MIIPINLYFDIYKINIIYSKNKIVFLNKISKFYIES